MNCIVHEVAKSQTQLSDFDFHKLKGLEVYMWTGREILVKNPPAMQETPVQFLGQEDPLEKG